MKLQIVVRELAERDLREAQEWYEAKRPGLGSDFQAAIDSLLGHVCRQPLAYPEVYRGVRRAVVRRFPYLLYFSLTSEAVVLLACLHGRRGSATVASRLSDG